MSLSKQRISSPLEAGRSILDAHNLPPQLTGALEYASKRLARKGLHITLIVVKNEYQLPNAPPCATPTSPPQTPEYSVSGFASPSRFTSPVAGLRQLVRRGTGSSLASSSSASTSSLSASETAPSALISPTFPPPPMEPLASPRRWILPLTPGSPPPSTPMTPLTPSSIVTTTTTSSYATSHSFQSSEPFGIRLIYTSLISPKDEKLIRATIAKAERKFHTETGGLPSVTTASACGLNADLVRRSILQNEVLFSSEGLTLLGLDRLYSFKAALAAYTRSIVKPNSRITTSLGSPGLSNHPINSMPPPTPISTTADSSRLEDAVDCLRRLVLSNGGRPVPKGELYRSFNWMGVNPSALGDVERMYRRAYGGLERRGPFEVPPTVSAEERERDRDANAKRMGFIKIGTPPPPKTQTTPILKLNTNIATPRLVKPKPKPVQETLVASIEISVDSKTREAKGTNRYTEGETRDNAEELEIRIDGLDIAAEHGSNCDCDEDDGDRTAHPLRDGPLRPSMFWPNGNALGASIDEMLSPCDNRQSQRLGPMTPNGYEDISPITRGEWGFLFKGDTWTQGRTAVVETC
ncbi:hypothetical protein HD806DRAFT_41652 [Xylariaceae sp. AK1471]|nr:hypothetical protein HD806DRAFT_41652 [Xylariaceae sp. AK1471]